MIDTTLLISIVVAALVARVAMTGRPYQVGPPAVAFGIGMLAGILALAINWAVTGRVRWQSRLPVLVLAWAFAWALPLAVGRIRGFEPGQFWELTIAEVAMFASLAIALRVGQARLRRRTLSEGATGTHQFHLNDLVIWTAAAGILLGVARHLSPRLQPPISTAFEAVGGASLGLTCATAYWAAGSRLPIALRLSVLLAVAVAAGSATEPFRIFIGLHPWRWYVSINITAALCVASALLIVRLRRDRFTGEEQ
jgi:hypothetical protein